MSTISVSPANVGDPVKNPNPSAESEASGPPIPLQAISSEAAGPSGEDSHRDEPGAKWREKDVYDIPYK